MLKVTFTVDRDHLAYRLWFSPAVSLSEKRWASSKQTILKQFDGSAAVDLFNSLSSYRAINPVVLRGQPDRDPILNRADVLAVLDAISRSAIFHSYHQAALKNLQQIKTAWESAYGIVAPFLELLAGAHKANTFNVSILPPELGEGSYLGHNLIEWGHPEIYPGYSVVGIAHEIMHGIASSIDCDNNDQWFLHGLIYLLADEQLRLRLIPDSEQFDPRVTKHYNARLIAIASEIAKSPGWVNKADDLSIAELFSNVRDGFLERNANSNNVVRVT